jgi:hypothetical protein
MNVNQVRTSTSMTGPNIERGLLLADTSCGHRKIVDQVLRRCSALPADDCDVLRAIYDGGQTAAQTARLAGQSARVFRRRIRRLVARVLSREFAFVVNHRSDWSPARRAVANAVFIDGRPIKEAAPIAKLSYYSARRHYWAILDLLERYERREELAA